MVQNSPYNTFADGTAAYVKNLAVSLIAEDREVMVVAFSRKVDREKVIKNDGIIYWCFPDKNYSFVVKNILMLKFIFRYKKIKASFSPDLINAQASFAWPLVLVKDIPRIVTLHGSVPFWYTPPVERFWRKIFGQLIYHRLDGMIFISRAVEKAAVKFYPKIRKLRRQVIYPSIEPPKKMPKLKIPDKKIKIISAGRIVDIKNFSGLVEAFEILKTKTPDIELEIYGEGSLRHKLGQYAKGALPHEKLMQKISEADIFVLPSFSEVVPTVILEAISLGKPVIIADWATAPELVKDNQSGYIIKTPPNKEAIVSALQRAIADKANWPNIVAAANKTLKTKFDSKKNTFALLEFYQQVNKKCQ